jgi:uncharacterized protein YjbI with pentapeptide repeats
VFLIICLGKESMVNVTKNGKLVVKNLKGNILSPYDVQFDDLNDFNNHFGLIEIKETKIQQSHFKKNIEVPGLNSIIRCNNFQKFIFTDCNFQRIDLSLVNFQNTLFTNCKFVDCNLEKADCEDAIFDFCELIRCKLINTNFFRTKFIQTGIIKCQKFKDKDEDEPKKSNLFYGSAIYV